MAEETNKFEFTETVQGKLTLKKIADIKKRFTEDAYKAYTENAKIIEAKVTVPVYGEDYTYGITFVVPNRITMSYQEIFECEHFDDNIKVFNGLYGTRDISSAWKILEKDLNSCRV